MKKAERKKSESASLPASIEQTIHQKVASGRYASADEVISRAFAVLDIFEREEEHIRRSIALGIEQLDRGEGIPGEQVIAELRELNRRDLEESG